VSIEPAGVPVLLAYSCYYWHLKVRALNGGRSTLSDRELEFVGVGCSPTNTPGWRSAAIDSADELEAVGLSAEVSATLHALMEIEFLG
jgi:hypothetical protein